MQLQARMLELETSITQLTAANARLEGLVAAQASMATCLETTVDASTSTCKVEASQGLENILIQAGTSQLWISSQDTAPISTSPGS